MRRGLLTAFLEFNARGGYNGRQLQLRTVYHDDIDATLLFQINALAADTTIGVIGMVNTTIIEYVKPLLLAKNIPIIGASTGSAQIHDTFNRLIINTRPSYNSEVGAIVNYLTNQLLHRRIGFVYRNISLGRGAYNSFKTVMSSLGLTPHSVNMYVDDLTIACSSVPIDTQSIIIATDVGAHVISLATCLRKVTIVTLSNIDSNDFNGNLPNGIQVYSSQFIPNVDDTSISLSTTFTSAYNASYPNNQPTTISFEGYIVGKLVTSVLGTMTDGKVTRVTKGTFITNVYKASEISVGGLALGPYTLSSCSQTVSNGTNGTSVSSSVGLSTTCCNSGAKMVYLASVTSKGTTVPLAKSETSYTTCGLTLNTLTLPIIFSQSVHGVSNSSTAAYRFALGVTAAFNDHNDKGGVQSRRLALLSLDNLANATLHGEQLQYLTNKIPSIALLGEDNSDMTATRLASVPLIATRTGNIALRSPYNSSYINVRPSMVDKAAAAATLFVKRLGFSDYAPAYQSDDSYHTQSHEHFCNYAYQVLDGYCKKTFGFTSANIDAVAQAIVQSSMRGIAIFANQRDSVYLATKLLTLSTTINVAIVHDDLDSVSSFSKLYGGRLFVVQSFPFLDIDVVGAAMVSGSATLPNNATLPVYFETFVNSMNSSGNLKYSDSSSLEGYLVGRFIVSALVNTINTITSKSVLASIYQQSLFSIEGFELGPIGLDCGSSSSPYCGCNQMMHSVTVAQMGVPVGTNDQGVTVYGASDVPMYRFTFSSML
jgi:ABC-type branched-subunit amino acid transport system substrate-binding protein